MVIDLNETMIKASWNLWGEWQLFPDYRETGIEKLLQFSNQMYETTDSSSYPFIEHGIHRRTCFYYSLRHNNDRSLAWQHVADIHCLEKTRNKKSDQFPVR